MKSLVHPKYGVYSEYQHQKTERQSVIQEDIQIDEDSVNLEEM